MMMMMMMMNMIMMMIMLAEKTPNKNFEVHVLVNRSTTNTSNKTRMEQ